MGVFIQWHRVVICICCALFVTSQFDVIVLFPNQRFSEVRWHNMHVFLYILSPYFMCHCTEYNLLALQVRLSEENTVHRTLRYTVRNCKNIRRCVKAREYNTLINSSEQFTAENWGCANVLSNMSSRAQSKCGWTGWRTPRSEKSNLAKLHKNWECAQSTPENFRFCCYF